MDTDPSDSQLVPNNTMLVPAKPLPLLAHKPTALLPTPRRLPSFKAQLDTDPLINIEDATRAIFCFPLFFLEESTHINLMKLLGR
jgi:hypothetical protein